MVTCSQCEATSDDPRHKRGCPRQSDRERILELEEALLLGDAQHPDTRDYVATNLLANVDRMPNTGDWHGQLKRWAEANTTGKLSAIPAPEPEDDKLREFDAWLSFRPEFAEVMKAFRSAFGTDTSAFPAPEGSEA